MPGLNRVLLIGNLGKDPETRFTPKGSKVCAFSLAVSRQWKNREGERQEATEWFNIEAWGRLGEICQQYLHKGSKVYVEGRLQTRKWQDQSGQDRYTTEIVANDMQMLDSRAGGDVAYEPRQRQDSQPARAADSGSGSGSEWVDDDIPF